MPAIEWQGAVLMNEDQHRRRSAVWLGSIPVIAAFLLLIMVLMLSDRVAPDIPNKMDGSTPIQQGRHSPELEGQGSESISPDAP